MGRALKVMCVQNAYLLKLWNLHIKCYVLHQLINLAFLSDLKIIYKLQRNGYPQF